MENQNETEGGVSDERFRMKEVSVLGFPVQVNERAAYTCFGSLAILFVMAMIANTKLWYTLTGLDIFVCAFGFRNTPMAHYGLERVFGKRTGEYTLEGLSFTWPFVGVIERVFNKLLILPMSFDVITRDGQKITLEGSAKVRPANPRTSYLSLDGWRSLLSKYFELAEETEGEVEEAIGTGLKDAIKSVVGGIAGSMDADAFIESRDILELIINCVARLEIAPHENRKKSLPGVDWENENPIPQGKLIKFYTVYQKAIRKLLDDEGLKFTCSKVEKQFAVDFETYDLGEPKFTEEVQAAMEAKRIAEKNSEAAQVLAKKFGEIFDDLVKNKKLKPKVAADRANVLMGLATQSLTSIEGGGFPIVNAGD